MASVFRNPYIDIYVPSNWEGLIPVFGLPANYLPDNDPAQSVAIVLIWAEGTEDEDVSPGRFSHARIRNADLPRPPKLGDGIEKDGMQYDVVRINALPYDFSIVVLQDAMEIF